ncbi:MAG TPA: DUF3109 family protein [Terriglobia bacterium]|nr:DUF3109 family protein [Terriglobia bacterium]
MSDDIQRRHQMPHIKDLRVDPEIARARFPASCSMTKCSGVCCRYGVWMDPTEQDRILQHVGLIQGAMEAHMEKDPALWFEDEKPDDPDFPSGRAVGTAASDTGCVFLNTAGQCVLQIASTAETGSLKPFYCFAFPITVDNGLLGLTEGKDPACCIDNDDGPQNILDVCGGELAYVLGPEGLEEFRRKFKL